MQTYNSLAIPTLDKFLYGTSPHPVSLPNGMVIGGGTVYPELNFTLPNMLITKDTMPLVREEYTQMITSVVDRAIDLQAPGLVVELELLPELTLVPENGAEITAILHEVLANAESRGLKTALRATPNDIREFARPPMLRSGQYVDTMFRSFELCAKAGATFLAVESTGGKEVHDGAILNCDLPLSLFSLGILGCRDMEFVWDRIVEISRQNNVIPSGDTACGFANTALALAEQKFIPRVWAALIRVMSVVRSLVAMERGAVGPHKDCGYEGVYIKAITGCPIALEGAEAACAHLSTIGNIAKAVPDLWSNESVNNVKLLSAMAPTVSVEQLIYATRLMNVASAEGPDSARRLRDWWVKSDSALDPQAYVLRPDVAIEISKEIVAVEGHFNRTRVAALAGLAHMRKAYQSGALNLSKMELRWLDKLQVQADALPETEDALLEQVRPQLDPAKVLIAEYGLV